MAGSGPEEQGDGDPEDSRLAVAPGAPSRPLPTPRLSIGVSSRISLVGRSVENAAEARIRQEQIALADSLIDLRQSPIQHLEISAERDLRGFADSRGAGASLLQEGGLTAMGGSTVLGSDLDSRYSVTASDALRLGVRGLDGVELAVSDRVSGLTASALEDPDGQDALTILASLDLLLTGAPDGGATPPLQLHSTAMDDSTVRLGPGDDQVRIGAELRLSTDAAATAVNGSAVGLRNSLLETGSGNDRVEIVALVAAATTDRSGAEQGDGEPWPAAGMEAIALEAVALEDARLQLGSGDDRLLLRGDVRRSSLEPGPGQDFVVLENGSLRDSVLRLDPAGRVAVKLSDGDDSLRIEGSGAVELKAAGGDDRIMIGAAASGWVDGGTGEDSLELEAWDWPAAVPASSSANNDSIRLQGGPGQDLFVLPDLGSLLGWRSPTAAWPVRRTSLLDLTWLERPGAGPGLSDRLALRRSQAPEAVPGPRSASGTALILLSPSGLEGIGDARLLPIAPIEQLLAGTAEATPQLAIATASTGSELVLLGSGAGALPLAALPGLRSRGLTPAAEDTAAGQLPARTAGLL